MKRIAVVFLAASLLGCVAPISVSHYETANPVPGGGIQVSTGVHAVGKDGRYGLDRPQTAGTGVSRHFEGAWFVPDVQVAYGITEFLSVHAQAFAFGGEAGVRGTFLNTENFKVAGEASVGMFSGSRNARREETDGAGNVISSVETRRSYTGYYIDLPLTITMQPVQAFAFNFGPVVTFVKAHKSFIHLVDEVPTQVYNVDHQAWELGAFAGFSFGDDQFRISPGMTVYLEATSYPVEDFEGDGFFAMPWVGITGNIGGRKKARVTPPMDPPPPPPVSGPPPAE